MIIHEIKNPLGIIRVSSGTLKKRFEPPDSGHELASFIEEEGGRIRIQDREGGGVAFRVTLPAPAPGR